MALVILILLPLVVLITIDDIRAGNKMQRRNKRIRQRHHRWQGRA